MQKLRLWCVPLLFQADHHIHGTPTEVASGAECFLRFPPHNQGAQIGKAKNLVEAEDGEVGGFIGSAEIER